MSFVITARGPDGTLLHKEPMGAQRTVLRYWAEPARALGLTLLSELPEEDLTVRHALLGDLRAELGALSQHWAEAVPGDELTKHVIGGTVFEVPILVHLFHRLSLTKATVRVAEVSGGYIYI